MRVAFKKKATQKQSEITIIVVHRFLFLTRSITDIRTVVTTLLFTATVLTSAHYGPGWLYGAVLETKNNQQETTNFLSAT